MFMENQSEKMAQQGGDIGARQDARAGTVALLATTPITMSGISKPAVAGPSWRRPGKQVMEDDRTDEERAPIIVDLGKARGTSRARLVAIGVFLSVIAITSKQLVSYMKNVWKLRGAVESLQLADMRFVLDFSLEGDFEHVTRGGPWGYQGDVVLVRKLKEGEDPHMVRFESMPIWVQFTRIPFYLLSKQLARDLGRKIGEYICIDNDARGDICDKIIRARVHLPIARALQKWITLEDEYSDEEVVVTVLYERLPSSCLSCGVIGHKEETCDLPTMLRKRMYSLALGVRATHFGDARKWYLPKSAGEVGRALQMDTPWRNVAALGARLDPATRVLAIVTNVVKEVEKLSVHDKEGEDGTAGDTSGIIKDSDKTKHAAPPPAAAVESKADNDTDGIVTNTMTTGTTENSGSTAAVIVPSTWKRMAREVHGTENSNNEETVKKRKDSNNLKQQKENATLAPAEGGGVGAGQASRGDTAAAGRQQRH
ncbi:hypothetical protein ACQ4PT_042400 [Festuca glaucescens]